MTKTGVRLAQPVVVAFLGVLLGCPVAFGLETKDQSKFTIKEVMMTAYKQKLANKVIKGEASEAEKKRLLTLYEALAKTAPPRGNPVSWKKKTDALVDAAQAAIEGEHNAPTLLKKTMECGACHSNHK